MYLVVVTLVLTKFRDNMLICSLQNVQGSSLAMKTFHTEIRTTVKLQR